MKPKIKARILTCMPICLSIFSNASCSAKTYEVAYLTDTNINIVSDDITLISSHSELNDYKETPRFSNASNNIIEKMESYSSEFFDKKMLIVINLQESTRSSKINVEKIDYKDNKATITLKRKVPAAADDSIKIWSIFIEDAIQEISSVKYTFQ